MELSPKSDAMATTGEANLAGIGTERSQPYRPHRHRHILRCHRSATIEM
jgi:hypothetical protein